MDCNKSGDKEKTIDDLFEEIEIIKNNIYFLMKGIGILFLIIFICLIYLIILVD